MKKKFNELTESEKDGIVNYITRTGISIQKATVHFNLSLATINKIYETRYISKRDKQILKENNHE